MGGGGGEGAGSSSTQRGLLKLSFDVNSSFSVDKRGIPESGTSQLENARVKRGKEIPVQRGTGIFCFPF